MFFCISAQEHIKFNGATFGQEVNSFVSSFPNSPKVEKRTNKKGFDPNVYNLHHCEVRINAEIWKCDIYSSRKSNEVFRTVCVKYYNDLQSGLMLLVKALESKYGDHIQAKEEDLGEIELYYGSFMASNYRKEMLALYYEIKDVDGKTIGEIRISAAPNGKLNGKDMGFIELSYTDYKARKKADNEYNSIMNNVL